MLNNENRGMVKSITRLELQAESYVSGKPLKIMGTNSTDHDVDDEVKPNNDVRCVPSIQDLTP